MILTGLSTRLTAGDLEQGLAQLVARAHEHGIKVFGATMTGYKGAGYFTEKGRSDSRGGEPLDFDVGRI